MLRCISSVGCELKSLGDIPEVYQSEWKELIPFDSGDWEPRSSTKYVPKVLECQIEGSLGGRDCHLNSITMRGTQWSKEISRICQWDFQTVMSRLEIPA